jgi:hypothetical protein
VSQESQVKGRKFVWFGIVVGDMKFLCKRERKRVGSRCSHGEWILEKYGTYLEHLGAED